MNTESKGRNVGELVIGIGLRKTIFLFTFYQSLFQSRERSARRSNQTKDHQRNRIALHLKLEFKELLSPAYSVLLND